MGKDIIIQLTDKISIHGQEIPGKCSLRAAYQKKLIAFWYNFLNEHNIKNSFKQPKHNPTLGGTSELDNICTFKHSTYIPLRLFVMGYMDMPAWHSFTKVSTENSFTRDTSTGKLEKPLVVPASTRSNLPIFASNTQKYYAHYLLTNFKEIAVPLANYAKKKGIPVPGPFYKKDFENICAILTKDLYDAAEAIYILCSAYTEKHSMILSGFSIQFGIDETGDIVVTDKFLSSDEAFYFMKGHWKPDESIKPYDLKGIIDYIYSSSYLSNVPLSQIVIPEQLFADSGSKLLDLFYYLSPQSMNKKKTTE